MNVNDFASEVVHGLPQGPGYQFDPLTLTILLAIVSAVVEHFMTKCLDRYDAGEVRNPGPLQRLALKRQVHAEFRARAPHLSGQFADPVYQFAKPKAPTAKPLMPASDSERHQPL